MIEKDPAGGRQCDAPRAALQQGNADFQFQVVNLAA